MRAGAYSGRVFPGLTEARARFVGPVTKRGCVMELPGGFKLRSQIFRDLLRALVFFNPFVVGQGGEARLGEPLLKVRSARLFPPWLSNRSRYPLIARPTAIGNGLISKASSPGCSKRRTHRGASRDRTLERPLRLLEILEEE